MHDGSHLVCLIVVFEDGGVSLLFYIFGERKDPSNDRSAIKFSSVSLFLSLSLDEDGSK